MQIKTAYLSHDEIKSKKAETTDIYFKTTIPFLSGHNSYRRGKVHILLGTSGSGKSTLLRTMLLDMVVHLGKRKAILVLSEETVDDFLREIAKIGAVSDKWKNLLVVEESQLTGNGDVLDFLQNLSELIERENISIVFYDNITTSDHYMDQPVSRQSVFCKDIKQIAIHYNIPMVLVAHTKSEIKENHNAIISMEDVRGTKSLTNLAEFFYIIQALQVKREVLQFLRVAKCRGYDRSPIFYRLKYDRKMSAFTEFQEKDFEAFKLVFKEIHKL